MHYWNVDNWMCLIQRQRPWTGIIWCGFIRKKLVGPVFINGKLNGEKYRDLLRSELPKLLADLNSEVRQNMWFQNDGCSSQYSPIVRNELYRQFSCR